MPERPIPTVSDGPSDQGSSRADVQPGRARYDPALGAWVLSSHADVSAALREPCLVAVDFAEGSGVHRAVQGAVARVLSVDRLGQWRAGFERTALECAAALPADRPVDLLESFAVPWALSLALTVTAASPTAPTELAQLAREVFLAAAFRTDAGGQPAAQSAATELARRLPAAEATVNVQTFVALSQTLPHLLAGAWLALFSDPAATLRLRNESGLLRRAVDELIRHAGPSRAVFRRALEGVRVGGAMIEGGDRVVLMLAAANHDPARFPDPDRLDLDREVRDHVAFGGGPHSCSGARLTRAAAVAATAALLRTTAAIELAGPVQWIDGFAIRAPASLPAVLRRASH